VGEEKGKCKGFGENVVQASVAYLANVARVVRSVFASDSRGRVSIMG